PLPTRSSYKSPRRHRSGCPPPGTVPLLNGSCLACCPAADKSPSATHCRRLHASSSRSPRPSARAGRYIPQCPVEAYSAAARRRAASPALSPRAFHPQACHPKPFLPPPLPPPSLPPPFLSPPSLPPPFLPPAF